MRTLILGVAAWMISLNAHGQGHVYFNTIFGGQIDARVVLPDGTGAGEGWTAQVWIDTPDAGLKPVYPTAKFKTSSAAARGYVEPVDLSIPEVPIEEMATLVVRAFNGKNWLDSTQRYESNSFTIRLEGGRLPPARMIGLEFFTLVSEEKPPLAEPQLSIRAMQSGRHVTVVNVSNESITLERATDLGVGVWKRISLPVVDGKAQYIDTSNDPVAFFRTKN